MKEKLADEPGARCFFDIYFIRDQFLAFLYYGAASLSICAASLIGGGVIGAVLCLMHFSRLKTLNAVAGVLVGAVRALPELVLIFWLYSCLPLITGVTLNALSTGLISLSLFAAAYLSEIFRAGLLAIGIGQREAGYSLGLSRLMVLRLIILPQATKIMIGPLLNFMCDLIKASTLLSALSIHEMSFYASSLGAETYKYLEIYTMVGAIYFVVIFAMSSAAKRYLARRELVLAS